MKVVSIPSWQHVAEYPTPDNDVVNNIAEDVVLQENRSGAMKTGEGFLALSFLLAVESQLCKNRPGKNRPGNLQSCTNSLSNSTRFVLKMFKILLW